MNRILLFLLLLTACFSGCKKTNDVIAEIRTQQVADEKIIRDYLSAHNLTAKTSDSAGVSRVFYIVDTLGTGNDIYTSSTSVTVGYIGSLLSTGVAFAQTGNIHPAYVLGQTIRGWQLGIPNVKKGGTITLIIPSHYAYGPYPQPTLGLPANAILVFKITVFDITN